MNTPDPQPDNDVPAERSPLLDHPLIPMEEFKEKLRSALEVPKYDPKDISPMLHQSAVPAPKQRRTSKK